MLSKKWIVCLLFSFLIGEIFAQVNSEAVKSKAIEFYNSGKYSKAIPLFLRYQTFDPKDIGVKYLIGISYLYVNKSERAKAYLTYVIKDKKPIDDAYMYLGQACQQNKEFDNAIRYYKRYLSKMKMKDPFRESIKDDIKRCVVGRKLLYLDPNADVENVEIVNTQNDEFAPLLFNQSDLYFSTIRDDNFGGILNDLGVKDTLKGKARSDIFISVRKNGDWTEPKPFEDKKYNSRKHDMLTSIGKNKKTLYFYKGDKLNEGGNIYTANSFTEVPEFVKIPISSPYWDGNAQFFNDTIVLFSSKRQGGFGGKDLYISIMNSITGQWTLPENLGPEINTPYDEDCPFLSKNGRTLYFSSNNLKSMGGYDIFTSFFLDSSRTWMTPANLGIPVNSSGDDLHFKLSDNGLKAYFSSERPDGFGGMDIYEGLFRRYLTEQLQYSSPLVFSQVLPPEPILTPEIPKEEEIIETPKEEQLPIVKPPKEETVVSPPKGTVIPDKPMEVKTYQFSAINYKLNSSELQPSGMVTLRKLSGLMKTYQQLNLTVTSHTDSSGDTVNNLYYAGKRAQVMTDYLINEGIASERISIKACGANYPRARNKNEDGTKNMLGQILNRRMDVKVTNTGDTPVRVEESDPVINSSMRDDSYSKFKSISNGLSYKIQIIATESRFESDVLIEYPDAMLERSLPSKLYRVTVGLYKRFSDADNLRLTMKNTGFTGAYVVPYIDGIRISREDAAAYKDVFPNLINYLNATKN